MPKGEGALRLLVAELRGLFDLFLPPRCALCGEEAPVDDGFCSSCRAAIPPLLPPCCPRCALPYPAENGSNHLCQECLRHPPPFEEVRVVSVYEDAMKRAINLFKYEDGICLDRPFATLLAELLDRTPLSLSPDLILPVPLHVSRLRERTYNQSDLLARCLGKKIDVSVDSDLLVRSQKTPIQQGLDLEARRRNLRNAFRVTRPLRGEKILLVDDVMTTGATARACALSLKRGGAGAVSVAVLARARRHNLRVAG